MKTRSRQTSHYSSVLYTNQWRIKDFPEGVIYNHKEWGAQTHYLIKSVADLEFPMY